MANGIKTDDIFVTFVLPCLNESKTLGQCIKQAREAIALINKPASIIVADNGSTDSSQEIAKEYGAHVIDVPIRGYGAAIYYGCKAACSRYIVIGDTDGSYDFRESISLLQLLDQGYDLIIGSRIKGKIYPGAMPWKNRYLGTPTLTFLLNLFYHTHISDSQSGLRAFRKDAFDRLNLHSSGMEFASEMLVQASLCNLKISEFPVSLHPDGRNRKPHLRPWRDGWRHLRFLLLYSPVWLYLVPGFLLLAMGLIVNSIFFLTPETNFITIRNLFFGTHWMVPFILSSVVGMQMIGLGIFTSIYSVQRKFYSGTQIINWFNKHFRLEWSLLVGLVMLLLGTGIEFLILFRWIMSSYGELNAYRTALYGLMWIVLGAEIVTNGFFLDLLCHESQIASIEEIKNETI
jgi:glycosyltransferase involved in cell wall biosynthesis